MDKILTVKDVANILQVTAITVREMFRTSRIRGFKVGKGWRTTEEMLREDIAAFARGEAPAVIARPAVPAGNGKRHAKKAAVSKVPRARKESKKSEEPATVNINSNNHEDADDTQQLLF